MCACDVLWRRKGENRECVQGGEENEKGKEKTDEDSSVLLYFMTEEGERE